jgi:hypothetical protein
MFPTSFCLTFLLLLFIAPTHPQNTVTLPTSVTIPAGGCSDPSTANLSTPALNLLINFGSNPSGIYLADSQTNTLLFTYSSGTQQSFQLCSSASTSTSNTTNIPITLGGINQTNYTLNTNNITANLTENTNTTTTTTVSFSQPEFNGSDGTIRVTASRAGNLYYMIKVGTLAAAPDSLQTVENWVAISNPYTVQSQRDYLYYLVNRQLDYEVGMVTVLPGRSSYINKTSYTPGTNYTLCTYLTTNTTTNTTNTSNTTTILNSTCLPYQTPDYPNPAYRAYLEFTRNHTRAERNQLLCYFVEQIGYINSSYVINRRGESCNLTDGDPQRPWYRFNGSTFDNGSQIIYLLTNTTDDNSQYITNFQNMFDPTTQSLTPNSFTNINDAISGTLKSGRALTPITYSDTYNSTRTMSVGNVSYDVNVMTLNDVSFSGIGAMYFGVANRSSAYPTVDQFLNCLDGRNRSLINCTRMVTTGAMVLNWFI